MKAVAKIFLILFISQVVCASDSDEMLTQKLIGLWEDNVSDGDLVIKGTSNYTPDGTLESKGKIYINDQLVEEFSAIFKWEIKDGRSHLEVIETSNSEALHIGHKWSDKVISIDSNEFTYERDDGEQLTMKRIK